MYSRVYVFDPWFQNSRMKNLWRLFSCFSFSLNDSQFTSSSTSNRKILLSPSLPSPPFRFSIRKILILRSIISISFPYLILSIWMNTGNVAVDMARFRLLFSFVKILVTVMRYDLSINGTELSKSSRLRCNRKCFCFHDRISRLPLAN